MKKIMEDILKNSAYILLGTCFIASLYSSYPGKSNKELQYAHKIDSLYNVVISSKTKDKSLIKILNQYTPFTEKEKIVNGNKLEKGFK